MKTILFPAAMLLTLASNPAYSSGFVRLFEGNHCTQNSVGEVEVDRYRSISFKKDPYLENDEARSDLVAVGSVGRILSVMTSGT